MRSLRALPKAHLHVHLTACMRRSTVSELSRQYGLAEYDQVERWESFAKFGASYRAAQSVLRSPDDLRRLVDEAVCDAGAEGVVWFEPQTTVSSYAPVVGGEEATIELLVDAARLAGERYGVGVGLIVAANRESDPATAERQARLAARYADHGVIGFGLGGDERVPADAFSTAFGIAREAGLLSIPHAGELAGPDSIRTALDVLGADRIQHGVRSVDDPNLVERLARERICLDVCPSSNVALGVAETLETHPLAELLGAGVRCSINADGPLLFNTTLLEEYRRAQACLGLDERTLARVAQTSIEASAAPDAVRRSALSRLDEWLEPLGAT